MARPRVNEDELRSINFTIRLTAVEQKQLEQAAIVCGKSPAVLIREKVFNGKFPEPKPGKIELRTYVELKKIGVNLNQLTRIANASRINQKIVDLLVDLWKQQQQIIR